MLFIPVDPGIPYQEFSYRIDDVDYVLSFRWNFRREVWSLALFSSDKELIYSISSLVLSSYMGALSSHNLDFPFGCFVLIDTEGENKDATLQSLGSSHTLIFLTGEEVLSL